MMSQQAGFDPNALVKRIQRLVTLDSSVFDEVRSDASATIPAIVVAVVATFLFGVGGWLWWVLADIPEAGDIFVKSLILGSIFSLILWAVGVALTYVMLTTIFGARADVNELIRVMGFAAAPLALGVLIFIPAIEFGLALTVIALYFGSNVIAIQTVTDAPAGKVMAAAGVGFLVWAVVLGLFVGDKNAYAPGIFVFDVGVEWLKNIGDINSLF